MMKFAIALLCAAEVSAVSSAQLRDVVQQPERKDNSVLTHTPDTKAFASDELFRMSLASVRRVADVLRQAIQTDYSPEQLETVCMDLLENMFPDLGVLSKER